MLIIALEGFGMDLMKTNGFQTLLVDLYPLLLENHMDFKLYLWICIHCMIVSIVWFSGSHGVTDSTIWSSYLVTKFDSSRVTIDGESRSQCVRTSRTESGLAAPCR